jgi:hypothetical protein
MLQFVVEDFRRGLSGFSWHAATVAQDRPAHNCGISVTPLICVPFDLPSP